MTNVLQSIFDALGVGVEAFGGVLGKAFTAVAAIVWDSTTGITFIGTLMLITLIISLVLLAFNWIQRLINRRASK